MDNLYGIGCHGARTLPKKKRTAPSLSDQQTAGAYSQLISLRDATGTGPELPLIIEIVFVCFSFCSVPATILLDDGAAAVVVLILSQHIPAALCWRGPIGLSLSSSLIESRILKGILLASFASTIPPRDPGNVERDPLAKKKTEKRKKESKLSSPPFHI